MPEKKIYLIRHCKAEGQEPAAALTEEGHMDANALVPMLKHLQIDHILTSPYKRAIQTIQPFAERIGLTIQLMDNLRERTLSAEPMEDWLMQLQRTFDEVDLAFPGGESSNEALARIVEVIDSILLNPTMKNVVVVSHGNILALLLKKYDSSFGFEQWSKMKNPNVFLMYKVNDLVNIMELLNNEQSK